MRLALHGALDERGLRAPRPQVPWAAIVEPDRGVDEAVVLEPEALGAAGPGLLEHHATSLVP